MDFYKLTRSPNERFATRQRRRPAERRGLADDGGVGHPRSRPASRRPGAGLFRPGRRHGADPCAPTRRRLPKRGSSKPTKRGCRTVRTTLLAIADDVAGDLATLDRSSVTPGNEQVMPLYLGLGQLDRAEQLERSVVDAHERRLGHRVIALYREDRARLRAVLARELSRHRRPRVRPPRRSSRPGSSRRVGRLVAMAPHRRPAPVTCSRQYRRMLEGGLAMIENRPRRGHCVLRGLPRVQRRLPHRSREARVRRWLTTTWMAKGDVDRAIAGVGGRAAAPALDVRPLLSCRRTGCRTASARPGSIAKSNGAPTQAEAIEAELHDAARCGRRRPSHQATARGAGACGGGDAVESAGATVALD